MGGWDWRGVIARPALADPEIASKTFQTHLAELWGSPTPARRGWRRQRVDALHELITIHATRADETVDDYHVLLGAEYYDRWPPTAAFVNPETLEEALPGSRWLPAFAACPAWFQLHSGHPFPPEYAVNGAQHRQLLCFSGTAQYYMVDHNPEETAIWRPGERTVAMTLARLHELLQQPWYSQPSNE